LLHESRLSSIAAQIADAGVWVTPTLASQRAAAMAGTSAYTEALQRPEVAYVSAGTRAWWGSLAPAGNGTSGDHPRPGPEASPYYRIQRALVRALFDAGVSMMAGSDCPNPLMVPGFALHDELSALVESGLSPYDVLRMAIANAAANVGREAQFGVIAPGAAADLVMIGADPLESVRALRHPDAVMVRGEWLDRAELDRLLEEVAGAMEDGR
jgi:imidazolonepropionase-like amidohydrolase